MPLSSAQCNGKGSSFVQLRRMFGCIRVEGLRFCDLPWAENRRPCMSKVHAAGNSSCHPTPSGGFWTRPELVGGAARDKHEESFLLTPHRSARGKSHLRPATECGQRALPPAKSAPQAEPESGSQGNADGGRPNVYAHLPSDASYGLRETARRSPKTLHRNVASASACARRGKQNPRRHDGGKGGLKQCL